MSVSKGSKLFGVTNLKAWKGKLVLIYQPSWRSSPKAELQTHARVWRDGCILEARGWQLEKFVKYLGLVSVWNDQSRIRNHSRRFLYLEIWTGCKGRLWIVTKYSSFGFCDSLTWNSRHSTFRQNSILQNLQVLTYDSLLKWSEVIPHMGQWIICE